MLLQLVPPFEDYYKPSKELLAAVNTALFLQRPLLLSGEPGTGKTECANFVARQLKKAYPANFRNAKALRFNTKSVSQSTDLFYGYDAVAHFGDKSNRVKESFITFNSLGIALLCTQAPKDEWSRFHNYQAEVFDKKPSFGSVVLIDEIDKAPRDFPNDLLSELEKPPFKFSIKEMADLEIAQNAEMPIFIIITSNNEKGLPDAFLRRCVFHHINFPDSAALADIVKANLGLENLYIEPAITKFLELRNKNIAKKPATSELIDWIACLAHKDLLKDDLVKWRSADTAYKQKITETLGILAKSKTDFETLSSEIGG